ncbi:MAG: hypothetical protein QW767_03785 [Thermoprotei archaeon]
MKLSKLEAENLSPVFPKDSVFIDLQEIESRWRTLIAKHYEFTIPCFTCKFFYECNSGAKHDPVTCDILSDWFTQQLNLEAELAAKH